MVVLGEAAGAPVMGDSIKYTSFPRRMTGELLLVRFLLDFL